MLLTRDITAHQNLVREIVVFVNHQVELVSRGPYRGKHGLERTQSVFFLILYGISQNAAVYGPELLDTPVDMVMRLAVEKARAVYKDADNKLPVVAADTTVVLKGILGKPESEEDAFKILRQLSGNKHFVITGVAIIEGNSGKTHSFSETTEVVFDELSDKDIWDYIKTGEPLDKAGAYGIQGKGGRFIKCINGCFYNVMGFPLNRIYTQLRNLGII